MMPLAALDLCRPSLRSETMVRETAVAAIADFQTGPSRKASLDTKGRQCIQSLQVCARVRPMEMT